MKKLILGVAVVLASSLTLFAQEKKEIKIEKPNEKAKDEKHSKDKSPEQRADAITKRMMKVTSAPAEKEAKIKEINFSCEKQREMDRTANANNKEGLKTARKKRNLDREEKLKTVFSEEEYAKWEAHKKAMKAKQKEKKQEVKNAKSQAEEEMQEIVED